MRMMRVWATMLFLVAAVSPTGLRAQGAEPIEIPLRVEDGRLIVPVEASDGAQLQFIVGTSYTVLSESGAARVGDQPSLTMGGVAVRTDAVPAFPDEELTVAGKVMDGMVGSSTLNKFDVLIDVPQGRLLLKPIGRSVEWAGVTLSQPVPVRVMHALLFGLDVEFEGKAYGATLELNRPTLVVSQPVKEQTGIDDDDVGTLRLGYASFADTPAEVRDLLLFSAWDPSRKGFVVVGAPITFDCAISLSWVHREIRTCVR